MAPDAGPFVKPASVATARLEGTFPRTGSPLPTKITSSAVTSAPVQTRTTPQKRRAEFPSPVDRDSDSSLSEYEGADSDAETERLHISPQKQRPGMMVQHTISSIATKAAPMVFEVPSPEDMARPTDETTDNHPINPSPETPSRSPSKKRKRDENSPLPLPSSENPVGGKAITLPPLKKKVHTPTAPEPEKEAIETVEDNFEKRDRSTNGDASSRENAIVTNGYSEVIQQESDNGDAAEVTMIDLIPDGDAEGTANQPPSAPEEEEEAGDSAEIPREDEDIEKDLKKQKAIEELAEIEKIFAKLKDSIYNEKLHRVEIEMKLLNEGTHPEYVAQKKVIDDRLDEKVRLANAQYNHAMKSLDISTHVNRAQLHSQYFQETRQLREDTLYNCSELWYSIQRERRAGDALVPEYTLRFPNRQSTRIKQRMQYNWEVQILGGIQKHIGFPAAPDVDGATEEEKAEDFEALGIAPRVAAVARLVAPPGVMRLDDYERPLPHNSWAPAHPSPPSPAIHTAAQQQPQQGAHAHHLHRHHHHHRPHSHAPQQQQQQGPQYQPEPAGYPHRRVPSSGTSLGHPQSSAPLSSLLHPLSESSVKMEAQPSHTPLPSIKNTETFANFPTHLAQQQQRPPYSMGHHIHPFARISGSDPQHPPHGVTDGRRSPTPGERMIDELKRDGLKREAPQAIERPGGGGGGLRAPLGFRAGGSVGFS